VIDGLHAATCTARQLDPFARVLRPITTTAPGGGYDLAGLPILSVTSDGAVLAGTGPLSSPARLDLVRPNGTRTTLYRTTDVPLRTGEAAAITAAEGDNRWIVFAVSVGGPGQSDVTRLGVVDRASGTVTTFRRLPTGSTTIVLPPVLYEGRAYWSEVDNGGSGAVFTYDPATGSTATVDRGSMLGTPTVIGGGLYWHRNGHVVTYRRGRIPAGFPFDVGRFPRLVTDGTNTVWATTADTDGRISVRLVLSTPSMPAPLTLLDSATADTLIPLAVGGHYVVWDDDRGFSALDTRTGATASVGTSSPGFSTVAIGGGTIAVDQIGSKGGAQLSIGRIANLPALTC
jgi:hypothetical protein